MEQCRGGCSHEMVDGSAAAASLKSQDILICENCGSEFIKRTSLRMQYGTVSRLSDDNQPTYCSKCNIYQLDVGTCSEMIDRITRSYLASYENQIKIEKMNPTNTDRENNVSYAAEKRTRKQRRPQKLPTNDNQIGANISARNICKTLTRSKQRRIVEIRERYLAQLVSRKGLLKCYRCSRYASARASMWVPYHTKASLALHTLWRHFGPRIRRVKREPRSVTLRATVYTHRADAFRGVR